MEGNVHRHDATNNVLAFSTNIPNPGPETKGNSQTHNQKYGDSNENLTKGIDGTYRT